MNLIDRLAAHRVVPVVVIDDARSAAGLADALAAGGLPVAEVTFRTDAAAASIEAIRKHGKVLVGAGTVTTVEQVDCAVSAGAEFVVSPGVSRAIIDRCREHGVFALPGAITATEIMAALDAGISTVKFFPAGTSGGVAAITALAPPFPSVRFVPTGGIDATSAAEYLQLPSVLAVGGSWMVPRAAIAARDFGQVRDLAAQSVAGLATPATF